MEVSATRQAVSTVGLFKGVLILANTYYKGNCFFELTLY